MNSPHGDPFEGLEPVPLWEHFRRITEIPRCSGGEGKVRESVIQVAKKCRLEYKIDKIGNVRIRKAAVKGMENRPGIALQAHLDMVCEKESEAATDFSKDPIRLTREGRGWVAARGTTLGADNGIGLAACLAVLEDPGIKHGPLEILLTVQEEIGQIGAKAIARGMLESRILVNLDSEEDDVLYVGCAGSRDTEISMAPEREPKPSGYRAVKLQIKGLQGGHSGLNIHEGRANAIKLISRFLWDVGSRIDIRLARFEGGSKLNAIPREAEAFLLVPSRSVSHLKEEAVRFQKILRDEFGPADPGIVVEVGEPGNPAPSEVFLKEFQKRLLSLLLSIPHGVVAMSPSLAGLVQTSSNLAALKLEKGKIRIGTKQRSSVQSELAALSDVIQACSLLAGGRVRLAGESPPWKPNLDSRLLKTARSVYRELFRSEPRVKTVHAGLECGNLAEKFRGMDMISIGPRILGAHSPHEKVEIASVTRFWQFLLSLLSRSSEVR